MGRQPDNRASASARGYNAEWQRIRAEYLAVNPYCEICGALATDVHHRKSLRFGGTPDDYNLQSLCKSCHSKYTAKHQGFGHYSTMMRGVRETR